MNATQPAGGEPEALESALAARLAGEVRYVVIGDGEVSAGLLTHHPKLFASLDTATAQDGVLALGLDPKTLDAASATARELGGYMVLVVVDCDEAGGSISEPDVRERIHQAGLVLAALERLLWRQREGVAPDTRSQRIDEETRLALARCVLPDDPRAVPELEQAISDLQRELDLQRQLQVEHAATREAERVRVERLRELEARLDDLGGESLGAEVDRLRAEMDVMRSTRVWRLGNRWWELKRRLRPGRE